MNFGEFSIAVGLCVICPSFLIGQTSTPITAPVHTGPTSVQVTALEHKLASEKAKVAEDQKRVDEHQRLKNASESELSNNEARLARAQAILEKAQAANASDVVYNARSKISEIQSQILTNKLDIEKSDSAIQFAQGRIRLTDEVIQNTTQDLSEARSKVPPTPTFQSRHVTGQRREERLNHTTGEKYYVNVPYGYDLYSDGSRRPFR